MTREELARLTPEEKRVKIAEVCGWKLHMDTPFQRWLRPPDYVMSCGVLPDYLNDLNAIHEAEEKLTWEQKFVMHDHLCLKLVPIDEMTWRATAAQRADAFLLCV